MNRLVPALLLAATAALGHARAAEGPATPAQLDDPNFKVVFTAGANLSALNELVTRHLANHPGMFRYLAFEAKAAEGVGSLQMPGQFTGTMEQLIKSVACINHVAYTDLSPAGVTFVPISAEHAEPVCPRADTDMEAKEHMRRPIPGFDDIITLRQRALQPRSLVPPMPTQGSDGGPTP